MRKTPPFSGTFYLFFVPINNLTITAVARAWLITITIFTITIHNININKIHKFIFKRVINSVGSECYLDRVEVTGSNPVWPTKKNHSESGFFLEWEI